MKKRLKVYEFPVVIEKDREGWFFAHMPALQGCYTQGHTLEEALKNIREAIELHRIDRHLINFQKSHAHQRQSQN